MSRPGPSRRATEPATRPSDLVPLCFVDRMDLQDTPNATGDREKLARREGFEPPTLANGIGADAREDPGSNTLGGGVTESGGTPGGIRTPDPARQDARRQVRSPFASREITGTYVVDGGRNRQRAALTGTLDGTRTRRLTSESGSLARCIASRETPIRSSPASVGNDFDEAWRLASTDRPPASRTKTARPSR